MHIIGFGWFESDPEIKLTIAYWRSSLVTLLISCTCNKSCSYMQCTHMLQRKVKDNKTTSSIQLRACHYCKGCIASLECDVSVVTKILPAVPLLLFLEAPLFPGAMKCVRVRALFSGGINSLISVLERMEGCWKRSVSTSKCY